MAAPKNRGLGKGLEAAFRRCGNKYFQDGYGGSTARRTAEN